MVIQTNIHNQNFFQKEKFLKELGITILHVNLMAIYKVMEWILIYHQI